MKKLLSILLAALMLLSSVTVVMADDIEDAAEYEMFAGADVANYALYDNTTFPPVEGLINYTWYDDKLYVPASTAKDTVGYGCLPLRKTNESNSAQYDPITFAEILNGDNIYDYQLQIEFQRVTGTNYVKDVGIGLGNYQAENKAADSCADKPSVAKTIDFGNAFASVANGSTTTLTADVADILDEGTEQKFAYNSTEPNALTADNANLVAIKMTYNNSGTSKVNVIQINSVKLVKKQVSDEPVVDETVKSIDLIAEKVDGNSFLLTGNPPKPDENSYHFGIDSTNQASFGGSTPTVGGIYRLALGGRGGRTFESLLNGGKLEDYVIEFEVEKKSNGDVIEAIEFGLGAANTEGNTTFGQGKTYREYSTVIKTVPFDDFSAYYLDMVSGNKKSLSIPVKEIFNAGTAQSIVGTNGKDVPDFDGSTINEFVMQAKCTGGQAWSGVLKFNSIKLVKKTADITIDEENEIVNFSACDYTATPALAGAQAIVAYYNDYEGNGVYTLAYCDVLPLEAVDTNNATLSVSFDGTYGGAEVIKAFLFNSLDEITPLAKADVLER